MIDEKTRLQKRRNYIVLAEKAFLEEDRKLSLSFYKRALRFSSDEEYIDTLFNIALIYDELELFSESIRSYKEILLRDEDNPGAYYGIAIMEEAAGNLDTALEYFFKAIEKGMTIHSHKIAIISLKFHILFHHLGIKGDT